MICYDREEVLVCAPSNPAADLLCEKLGQLGVQQKEMLRLNAMMRDERHLPPAVLKFSRQSSGGNFVVPDLKEPHRRCVVYFDWFVEDWAADDTKYVDESLAASEVVQQEDMALCADVQLSLEADEWQRGRFAPKYEHGMHAFDRLVYETLQGAAAE